MYFISMLCVTRKRRWNFMTNTRSKTLNGKKGRPKLNIHFLNGEKYKKPTNKHKYLHFYSDHPIHSLKSIPYSQGIRIIRICSEECDRKLEIESLLEKFKERCYPDKLINECRVKLQSLSRFELLKPKTEFLINHLKINNPNILNSYGVHFSPTIHNTNRLFIVMPFYKNILNYSSVIKYLIQLSINQCNNQEIKTIARNLEYIVSFKRNQILSLLLKET